VFYVVKNQKEKKKVFLGGGSFFFAFFHEKFLWMGGVFGDFLPITQHIKNHKSSSSCDFFLTSS